MMRGIAALLCVWPAIVAASPYDGTYRQATDSDCAKIGEPGGALKIADGVFTGVGMSCQMTRPVNVVDMDATLYQMECGGGDGAWSARAMVMNTHEGDGIFMVWDGYVFRYARCPDPEPSGDAAPAAGD
ncbi:MAG: hypothetical protein GC146_16000 [Limimaricola sp.]|nr:hypothetical protein [Limimaricola sp.]MBI1418719.1 hypothetical protein [Limimaricola sp.]